MGTPSSQITATWVKAATTTTEWQLLQNICFTTLKQMWTGRSEDEIWDFVEANVYHIAEHLREEVSTCAIDGTTPKYELDDEQPPYIRAVGGQFLTLLVKLRSLDPFKVEEVCSNILISLGGKAFTTQKSHDGGVDFIGSDINIVPSSLTVPAACKAVIIGQTKRYKEGNIISERQVREFVGASLLRKQQLQIEGKIKALSPVILAFWTTSDFEPNAKIYARALGVWFMDGHTFCHYLNHLGMAEAIENLA